MPDRQRPMDEVRAHLIHRAGMVGGRGLLLPICEWPTCARLGRESAHLQSRGMGGSTDRDTYHNCAWLCERHARYSDGEYAGLGANDYNNAHHTLLGPRWLTLDAGQIAYERRRALKAVVAHNEELIAA